MRAALAAAVICIVPVVAGCGGDDDASAAPPDRDTLLLATTTSTQDSGLLDELLPSFEDSSGCSVKTVAVGSGEALDLGERGDADALLVHSPADERQFMRAGHGASREPVMHNDFVLLGPAADPAGTKSAGDAPAALTRIAETESEFASRGDGSGTHAKELSLWEEAGSEPRGGWYVETGQGIGPTLTIASQRGAYTLSDRGTYLATAGVELELLVEGDDELLNPYHVIVVRDEKVNRACARAFSDWITAPAPQRRIERFGVDAHGEPLFFPDARG